MIRKFEVGQPFVEGVTNYQEGTNFDFDDSGARLMYSFFNPTKEEISQITKGEYNFEVCELSGLMFFLSKFGSLHWTDAPYSPHLSPSVTFQPVTEEIGYSLNVFLVDAATGILRGLRLIGLPTKFSRQLKASIERYLQQPFDENNYQNKIDEAYAKYSADELVRIADYYCKGGKR